MPSGGLGCDEGISTMKLVVINADDHAGKAWRRPSDFAFAASDAVAPLVAIEFVRAAVAMPIAFIEQRGSYVPVAVMSPVAACNLFVRPEGGSGSVDTYHWHCAAIHFASVERRARTGSLFASLMTVV
jgi:hypothetical protein